MPLARGLAPFAVVAALSACTRPQPARVMVPMQPRDSVTSLAEAGPGAAETPAALPATARSVLGRWEGTGVQDDGTTWLMVVDISGLKAGACATALYPTVPCSGTWTCLTDSDGKTLNAVERITEGRRECVDGGMMRMFLTPDGALDWSWTGAGDNARARLRRTSGP